MEQLKSIERIDSESERVYLRNGVVLSFFLARYVHEISDALSLVLDRYLGLIPAGALTYVVPSATAEEWKELNDKTLARCKASLAPPGSRKRPMTSIHLNDAGASAPMYSFSIVGKATDEDVDEEMTLVQMTFGLDVLKNTQLEQFVANVKTIAGLLPFTSGYCSPTFLFSDLHKSKAWGEIRGLALRHPGYDVQYSRDSALTLDGKSRGARWLTLLGPGLVKKLGGLPALKRRLPAPIMLIELPTGLMIRAGTSPEIGDINRRADTPLLRHVAQAIEPVTVFEEVPMLIYLALRDEEVLRRWERRFLD